MSKIFFIFIFIIFILKNKISASSFNQPKFCPTASWNPNPITFANQSIVGNYTFTIFINTNNTIYVTNRDNHTILVWYEESINPIEIYHENFTYTESLFITLNGDIFIDDADRVLKWEASTNKLIIVMYTESWCSELFVDINHTPYCSMRHEHQVVKKSLNDPNITSITVVAGTGSKGSTSNELNEPVGIFVDINFDLYVADSVNDRVQLFPSGKLNGITVAGSNSPNPTINLFMPTGIVLDAEKNFFIADYLNHRIVGSSSNVFRCLVGCHGEGSQSNRLYYPHSFSFDRFGNIFVVDQVNHRIQKFEYLEKSCAISFNQPKFCPTASWNPNAIIFANQSIVGFDPSSIFVNTNNTVYVTNRDNSTILVWYEENIDPIEIYYGNFTYTESLFVTLNGDIFIDDDDADENGRALKWEANTNEFIIVMHVESHCFTLFVDINHTLYCSMRDGHQVVKKSLNDPNITSITVVAGTGSKGSESNELDSPVGIFVDINFDLYVADSVNDRVQLFPSGKLNGITVAGSDSLSLTINLVVPTGIVLDAEKNFFIVDYLNHRIVGSSSNVFRCLVGCHGEGSQSNRLSEPYRFSFDRFGNMFVVDQVNHRIQKFEYLEKSCVYSLLPRQNTYHSSLFTNNQRYSRNCDKKYFYYESIQVKVNVTGYYSFRSYSGTDVYGLIYRNVFNPLNPSENQFSADDDSEPNLQFRLNIRLTDDMTYVLVVTTSQTKQTSAFSIVALGDGQVTFKSISTPVKIQYEYSSQLTVDSPTYYRDFKIPKCYFATFEMKMITSGEYVIWSKGNMNNTYGYIYKNDFNALKPFENLLSQHDGSCNEGQFKLFVNLEMNTRYVLVVTTHRPKTIGNFSITISGQSNFTFKQINVGYIKSIGLTLDDILRDELRTNLTMKDQSVSIKISVVLTIIMFVGGVINSIFSLITFQNKQCQQVGCGLYLLASSITSFLSIGMLTIKVWFVVLTQIDASTSLSVLRGGCVSMEVVLKFCLYFDGWLNACVAIERATNVIKGVTFDKNKSRFYAKRTILVLPFCIIGTLTHEFLYRRLLVYPPEIEETNVGITERYILCVTRYTTAVQNYNTVILFFHLLAPFLINLCSALLIVFGGARQRSIARKDQSFKEHIREQFNEHKQLIISPTILLVLSIPRVIISLLPDGVKVSENLWLYLSAYLISFIPSMLVFIIFVVPSEFYMKIFKQAFICARQHNPIRQ